MKKKRIINVTTALVIALGVILLWRGIWTLTDLYLFPNQMWLSALISIIAGVIILISNRKLVERFR